MPKRKTAETKVEAPVPAAKSRKSTAIAGNHKRTTTKKAAQPSDVTGKADTAAVQSATAFVSGITEVPAPPAATCLYVAPTHEEIARLAWSYFETRGFAPGDPAQDWLRAERELMELAQNR